MTVSTVWFGPFSSISSLGAPNSFGTLATYAAGTSTPQATYQDANLTVLNQNPITLNALGQAFVFLTSGQAYKFVCFDSLGNQLWSEDNVIGGISSAAVVALIDSTVTESFIGALLYSQTAAEGAAGVVPTNYLYAPYTAPRYGVVFDGVTDNTTAMQNAILAAVTAGQTLEMYYAGTVLIGRLSTITGKLRIHGVGAEKTIIKVNAANWPYASSTLPIFSSAYDFEAEDVGFDQSWTYSAYGVPSGTYNDGASATTWGGNWLISLTGSNNRIFRCAFNNISRGVLIAGATNVEFSYNTGSSGASVSEAICATSGCSFVRKEHNYLVGPLWTNWNSVAQPYTGLACLHCFGDVDVAYSHNVTYGYQHVLNGNSKASARCVFNGNLIDTPVADTSFQNWQFVSISGNVIHMSGDMGIACDNSNYVSITGNVIDSVMTGCINIGGCTSGVVAGNICKDWMQGYTLINQLASRYSSSAGGWGAAITANYQGTDAGGFLLAISGNSCSMPTLPPVSDADGPIRAVALGIYIDSTTSTGHLSASVTGNYVQANYASLPLMMVFVPMYLTYLNGKSGTPIRGETFSNGNNSFVYLTDSGATGGVQYKHLVGTLGAGVVFTGALSGATLTIAAVPGTAWLSCKEVANFDWTETNNGSGA